MLSSFIIISIAVCLFACLFVIGFDWLVSSTIQVRYVFIVVADDMPLPTWLNTGDPRLHIVRHSQIFSSTANLPTFNSHALESSLHRIPGLAEHFIYANDDMFLNNNVSPLTFFTPDGAARIWSARYAVEGLKEGHALAVKNTLDVVQNRLRRWRVDGENTLKHVHKPLTVSMMRRAEELYGGVLHATESHPFRHKQVGSGECLFFGILIH